MRALALALLLAGCAAAAPYSVSIRKVGPDTSWLGDGPDMVITVHNDSPFARLLTVRCAGAPQDWEVAVPARGQVSAFGQLMSVDTRSEACSVSDYGTEARR